VSLHHSEGILFISNNVPNSNLSQHGCFCARLVNYAFSAYIAIGFDQHISYIWGKTRKFYNVTDAVCINK